MSEELTLLPCPACGGKADIIDSFERNDKGHVAIGWFAYCTRGCLTTSEHGSREKAAASWNALPRAMTWTTEQPKVPGWYWFKGEYGIRIAWIKHDSRKMNELYAVIGGVGNWMSTLHGQWAGPIPEPQEPKGE